MDEKTSVKHNRPTVFQNSEVEQKKFEPEVPELFLCLIVGGRCTFQEYIELIYFSHVFFVLLHF